MITFEQLMDAVDAPEIRAIEIGAFAPDDVVNLALQRSEILRDRPRSGRLTRAWTAGDAGPLRAVVDEIGDDLIRRAAAIIWLEYQELKPTLGALKPGRVADIGCGYAMFDLFLWQEHDSDLLLIDLEQTDDRHFGFRETGAAYSSLVVANRFLTDNGVPGDRIVCRNPATTDVRDDGPVDLALSFISCGYHYPVATYHDFFAQAVSPDGAVILDLRSNQAAQGGRAQLEAFGTVTDLTDAAYGGARRVLLRKQPSG